MVDNGARATLFTHSWHTQDTFKIDIVCIINCSPYPHIRHFIQFFDAFLIKFWYFRRCWSHVTPSYRATSREISMCTGGILQNSLPKPTNKVWQTSPETAFPANGFCFSYRTVILCPASGEGSDWNHDQRHAYDGKFPMAQFLNGWLHVKL